MQNIEQHIRLHIVGSITLTGFFCERTSFESITKVSFESMSKVVYTSTHVACSHEARTATIAVVCLVRKFVPGLLRMYINVHVYIRIYELLYTQIRRCAYTYTYTYTYTPIQKYEHEHTWVSTHTYRNMKTRIIYIFVCVNIFKHVCMYRSIYTYIR